jgi:hypothetical protein
MWRPLLFFAIALVGTCLVVAALWIVERSVLLFLPDPHHLFVTMIYTVFLAMAVYLVWRSHHWALALVALGLLARLVFHLILAVNIHRMLSGVDVMESFMSPGWVMDLQWLTLCFPIGVFSILFTTSQRHLTNRSSQPPSGVNIST